MDSYSASEAIQAAFDEATTVVHRVFDLPRAYEDALRALAEQWAPELELEAAFRWVEDADPFAGDIETLAQIAASSWDQMLAAAGGVEYTSARVGDDAVFGRGKPRSNSYRAE